MLPPPQERSQLPERPGLRKDPWPSATDPFSEGRCRLAVEPGQTVGPEGKFVQNRDIDHKLAVYLPSRKDGRQRPGGQLSPPRRSGWRGLTIPGGGGEQARSLPRAGDFLWDHGKVPFSFGDSVPRRTGDTAEADPRSSERPGAARIYEEPFGRSGNRWAGRRRPDPVEGRESFGKERWLPAPARPGRSLPWVLEGCQILGRCSPLRALFEKGPEGKQVLRRGPKGFSGASPVWLRMT